MLDDLTTQAYLRLASAYVAQPSKAILAEARTFGADLLAQRIALELVADMQQAALRHVLEIYSDLDRETAMARCSDVLRHVLSGYNSETRERESFLRTVIEAAPAAINIRDSQGRYRLVNNLLADISASTPAEMVGRSSDQDPHVDYQDLDSTDDNSLVFETGQAIFNLEGRYIIDGKCSTWLSSKAPIMDDNGEVAFVATVAIDITERKRAEEDLRQSEQKFRRIVESHPLPVWLVEVETGNVLYESPAASALIGLDWPAKGPRNVRDYYADPADRIRYLAQLQDTGEVRDMELQVRRSDGTTIWVSLTSRLIASDGSNVAITSMIDLTERLAFEEELERQRDALHLSEKMSALGELLASVAHELNNPLSVVVGQSLLLMETVADERIRRRIERIGSAAERCARIVKTFLAMARQQPALSEPICVNEAVEAALEVCGPGLVQAGVEVTRQLSDDMPPVLADFDQISQVISNLIVNATHALEDSGRPARLWVSTSFRPAPNEVVIKVKDNGPGVPGEVRGRIFDPFFTTKEAGKGTGIGLTLCHRIIDAHGGRIRLDNRTDQGATFVIKLPCRSAMPAAEQEAVMQQLPDGRLRILVIDDEVGMTDVLSEVLRVDGHVVECANTGEAARRLLDEIRFDLILSDLRMPGLDGPTLYQHIETAYPDLARRVAFITGDTLSGDIQKFLQEARRPYLEKPAAPDDIRAFVRQIAAEED